MRTLWTVLVLILIFFLVRYAIRYESGPPANEIQKTYEKAIRQYRHEE